MGGLLGGSMGYGMGYDSEDSEDGGMMGFSADDLHELACQVLGGPRGSGPVLLGATAALSAALGAPAVNQLSMGRLLLPSAACPQFVERAGHSACKPHVARSAGLECL